MEIFKYWKVIMALMLITMTTTAVFLTLQFNTEKSATYSYCFESGWIAFQDFNSQYCNNIPSGIMKERYKVARLKFNEVCEKKYGVSIYKDFECTIDTNFVEYLNKKVTSLPGTRFLKLKNTGGQEGIHAGIDVSMPVGTSIKPQVNGYVYKVGYSSTGYGLFVVIANSDGKWLYGHCSKLKVQLKDIVTPDTVIALSGNSGRSTGPHVHIEKLKEDYK